MKLDQVMQLTHDLRHSVRLDVVIPPVEVAHQLAQDAENRFFILDEVKKHRDKPCVALLIVHFPVEIAIRTENVEHLLWVWHDRLIRRIAIAKQAIAVMDFIGLQCLVQFLIWEVSQSFVVNFLLVGIHSEEFAPNVPSA